MKIILTILLSIASTLSAFSQEKFDVKLKNDTIFYNKEPVFLCLSKGNNKRSVHALKNFQNKSFAMINFESVDTALKTTVMLPLIGIGYGVLYPNIEIEILIESFIRNKVIVNANIDTIGLNAYCKERGIQLVPFQVRKVTRPGGYDSVMVARANKDFENQIKFTIVNTSSQNVSVNIGNKSNNRTLEIPAGNSITEHARVDEKVCLLDNNNQPLVCKTVRVEDKNFTINESGSEFK